MKKQIKILLLIIVIVIFTSCSTNSDIKDNFCGVHINYQYCKCAFHNEYCGNIGMSKSEAKKFVYSKYDVWKGKSSKNEKEVEVEEMKDEKFGVFEKDGNLYLNSKPGEVLSIETEDLPYWAREQIATVGANIATVGPPDSIVSGDSNVLLNGIPIARINDSTAHGGVIVSGSTKIFVNGRPVAIIGGQTIDPTVTGQVPNVGGPITNNIN